MRKLLPFLLILFAITANAQSLPQVAPKGKGYYIKLTPQPPNGLSCLVGPYRSLAVVRDINGSMQGAHNFACHLTGTYAACHPILGNGMAYPKNYPYTASTNAAVPVGHRIPSDDALLLPLQGNPRPKPGLYGLYYGNDGSCVAYPKAQRAKYAALVQAGQGIFPYYSDSKCPNWPYFQIGIFNNTDGACE